MPLGCMRHYSAARVNTLIHRTQNRIEEEGRTRSRELELERSERAAEDEKTQRLLEEAAAGGLCLESIGVFWLVLGVVLATASSEIVKLAGAR